MPIDENARYRINPAQVDFELESADGHHTLASVTRDALEAYFGASGEAGCLAAYRDNWERIHRAVEQKIGRGGKPVVTTDDLRLG
jgi:hypothetical protein